MPFRSIPLIKQQSLASRLVSRTLLLAVAMSLIFALTLSTLNYRYNLSQLAQQSQLIEQSYLPSIAKGLWEVDPARLNILLDGVMTLQHVAEVSLVGEQGQKIQRHHPAKYDNFSIQDFPIIYELEGRQHLVGRLSLGLTNQQIKHNAIAQGFYIALTSTLAVMLSTLVLLFLFKNLVSRHLKTLATFANELDPNQINTALKLRRQPKNDELDAVVNAFNRLQVKVQAELAQRAQYEAELEQHKRQLEDKVKQRTQELQLANSELEEKTRELSLQNQDLDAYARTVAHDLKNPLTTIICYAKLLNNGSEKLDKFSRQDAFIRIEHTALKMNQIIDALLLLASIRQGNSVSISRLNMADIIGNVTQRLAKFAAEHDAMIRCASSWPDVMGYPQWVEEVWANYLSNAIKYGGTAPQIELGFHDNDSEIEFWVADGGRALSTAEQHDLFTAMRRFEPEKANGYGFGLAIVKRIVEQLGGQVGYRPSDRGGSLFWFSLPKA